MSSLMKNVNVKVKLSAGGQKFKTRETQYLLIFTTRKQTKEV